MSSFIPISSALKLQASNIDFKNLGKSTGFLGLGRKIYLVYDEQQGCWGIQHLNIIQRILRFTLGFYAETHKEIVGKNLMTHQSKLTSHAELAKRILEIWKIHILSPEPLQQEEDSPLFPSELKEGESPIALPLFQSNPTSLPSQPIYDATKHCFNGRRPRIEEQMAQLKQALQPEDLKNIQRACLFGEWEEMDYRIEKDDVRQGKDFKLLEKMAIELPELGNYAFFNTRGDGECGYRTIIDGLIYGDCIARDNMDGLKDSFREAFNRLAESWNALFPESERRVFERVKEDALIQLERMRDKDIASNIALLQEDSPFLKTFIDLLRFISISQIKFIQTENIEAKLLTNSDEKRKVLADLKTKHSLTEEESENLSYAVENYSFSALLLKGWELYDIPGNASKNAIKDQLRSLAQRVNVNDLQMLKYLAREQNHLSNKQNILAAPLAEMAEMGILSMDEFLRRKAFADANSPRGLWALGSDFVAIGYALNKNICCLYRDRYKENAFDIQKTFQDRPADFYGLNLTGQIHYNALLPLSCSS